MESSNYLGFISNGNELSIPREKEIVELEAHDEVIQSDECTCTNKKHIFDCEIENVAVDVIAGKNRKLRYVVEMAFCKECGAYYIPQKSYDYLEEKGTIAHKVKGGIRLFEYLSRGSSYDEEKEALDKIERELSREYDKLPKPVSRYAIDDGCGGLYDLQSQKNSAKKIYEMQDNINAMMQEPYVGRIDVSKSDGTNRKVLYIGKTEDKQIGNVHVYSSWSDVGRLFRRMTEESGSIGGKKMQVQLRRQIDINKGVLRGITDQFSRNSEFAEKGIYDKFLIEVLMSRKKSHQLTDIIATIQDKQNEIIEKACVANIIVQGCAGSGKTMVMLHRLSYWLYNNKSLKPEKIKILTPNENFNVHIGGLHSQLHLGDIEIMSVDQYYAMLLGKYDKSIALKGKVDEEENTEERFLNYVYSKAFLKAMDAGYEDLMSAYALPEEIELLGECVEKCGFTYKITRRMPDGKKILEMARIAPNVKAKNGTFGHEKEGLKAKLAQLDINYSKSEEKKKQAEIELQKLETNYKTELAAVFSKIEEHSKAGLKGLDEQIASEEKNLDSLKRSILRVLNGEKIRTSEAVIEKLQKMSKEEKKAAKALDDIKNKLNESESLEQVIAAIRASKTLRQNPTVEGYLLTYTKARRSISDQNTFLENAQIQKQELEQQLSEAETILDDNESRFIDEICEKYPSDIALSIFNKCYESAISEKLRELDLQKPEKTYRCELYARVYFAEKFWNKTVGEDELICIDEGQDVSYLEYERIVAQNKKHKARFNVYGDLNQRIKQGRGLATWEQLKRKLLAEEYLLNENYRNTNQITQYCNDVFNFDMTLTGVEGAPVRNIPFDEMVSEIAELAIHDERTAVILPRTMSKQRVTRARKLDNQRDKLSVKFDTSRISIMYVDEIKGIEFDRVYVVDQDMEKNERYIAFTRALDNLTIVH